MNTHVLLDHEPVADGGFYARAVLIIEGSLADHGYVAAEPGRIPRSIEASSRISARNVRVEVTPGIDAEFIQMRHTFESVSRAEVLTIHVGNVRGLDRIRIRMDALVSPCPRQVDLENANRVEAAEVARVSVVSEVRTDQGPAVETVELPILLSEPRGGWVRPAVTRRRMVLGA